MKMGPRLVDLVERCHYCIGMSMSGTWNHTASLSTSTGALLRGIVFPQAREAESRNIHHDSALRTLKA
jgi:hypothetical protein